ncbi:hypothetical protein GQR58_008068 [Nymphon striatum]|nr:hypothetical protein GQR58_008068 [Nymphon striatum]
MSKLKESAHVEISKNPSANPLAKTARNVDQPIRAKLPDIHKSTGYGTIAAACRIAGILGNPDEGDLHLLEKLEVSKLKNETCATFHPFFTIWCISGCRPPLSASSSTCGAEIGRLLSFKNGMKSENSVKEYEREKEREKEKREKDTSCSECQNELRNKKPDKFIMPDV